MIFFAFVQVEVLQKKFDDFKTDLQANEVRLAEMNEIAMQLMSLGQTEAALKIQTQIHELNTKWNSLQQMAQVKKDHFWMAKPPKEVTYHKYI